MMPRTALALIILLLAPRAQREPGWTTPGGDPGARRFSALAQITRENVSTLQQAWSFDTGATNLQGTPTVVGGLM
jgi:glucose dehydrogenase